MYRPYGKPLVAVLNALATFQPATVEQIRQRLPLALQAKTAHSVYLAVRYGLMTADGTQRPWTYSLVPDWLQRVEAKQGPVAAALEVPPAPPCAVDGAEQAMPAPLVLVATALASRSALEMAWGKF